MKTKVLLVAAALAAGPAFAQDAPKGDVAKGEKLFMADGCWQCHGIGGNGAALTGPKLSQTALPFDAFLHQLRQPASEMAPYEASIVSDAAAADIYAYLKSRPASPDLKDLPLLQRMGVK
jgi:mono/diheme cytochrome c family protein